MKVYNEEVHFSTKGEGDIVDLTDRVKEIVKKSGVKDGLVCIFVPGSTGAVTTIEHEPGLLKDLPNALERIAPRDAYYYHEETWHDGNGHSHVRASIIGASLTIPIKDYKIIHGTWQQIVFIELDIRKRERRLIIQVLGE